VGNLDINSKVTYIILTMMYMGNYLKKE